MKIRRNENRKRKAFTLLEILVVITLLALLAGFAISNVGSLFSGGQKKIAQTFVDSGMDTPLMAYRMAVGAYPTTEQGLEALIKAPEGTEGVWTGPYLKQKSIPQDPWGNPYHYKCPGVNNTDSYDLWSWGPDRVESADDICNWKKEDKK